MRVVSSINRGMKSLGWVLGRRGFGYALALTLLVIFGGSAGMYAFEREHGLKDYAGALWWTAMLITTMGSEYWPKSIEGRVLCLFLALYAFAAFGYVTAALASFFVEQDKKAAHAQADAITDSQIVMKELSDLRTEIKEMRRSIEEQHL